VGGIWKGGWGNFGSEISTLARGAERWAVDLPGRVSGWKGSTDVMFWRMQRLVSGLCRRGVGRCVHRI
jgi:hypothetical protein